jgi:competence protein ComEC
MIFAAAAAATAGVVAGGASLVASGHAAVAHRWPVAQEVDVTTFSGCVIGVPQVSPGRLRFELVQLQGAAPARRVRLSWYRAREAPKGGERWEFTAKLRAPRGLVNPGSGDYALALLQAGVDGTGTVREARRLATAGCLQAGERWRQPIDDVRALLAKRLVAAVQASPSSVSVSSSSQVVSPSLAQTGTGLLLALALGLQDEVPDAQWRVFSVTGISHLVAISGLHVTLFAWLVLIAVRRVKGRGQLAPAAGLGAWSALLAVLAALAYALLAGGNLPALRTVWMLALGLIVVRLRRHAGIADAWGVALVGALWLDPFAAASLGFWLSFGAVGALLWSDAGRPVVQTQVIAPVAGRGSSTLQRVAAVAGPFLMAQWVVTLVLAPLLAASVGLPAWVSLPVNAIAIPLFSVVLVPAVLLATVGVAVAPLLAPLMTPLVGHLVSKAAAAWWVQGVATALGACVVALQWCAALPGVHWSPAAPGVLAAVVALGLALGACTPLLSRRARAGAAVCCTAVLLWPAPRPAQGGFQLQVLDVGQGSAAVVETAHHAVVFDPGPAYGPEADAGGRVVVPFLRASGWHAVAAVVVSHADADHSAGLGQVLQRFPEAIVWWGGDGGAAAHGRQPCRAGLQWRLDGVEFTFLHPGAVPERDDNSGSCVLLVRAAGRAALLLADIPQRIEDQLVAAGPLPVDIVLVAHHGSATASGEALRTATQVPEGGHAVVSAGYRNRWGFPKPPVRAGWQAAGRQVWVTAEEGALQFEVAPNGTLRVVPLRRLQPRWWRPALLAAPT